MSGLTQKEQDTMAVRVVVIIALAAAAVVWGTKTGRIKIENRKVEVPAGPTAEQRAEMEKKVAPYRNPGNLFKLLIWNQEAK